MYEIAVCDDRAIDRAQLIEYIRKNRIGDEGIRIHEYASGEELMDALDEIEFSMIFLDLQMDGMDGEETARRIRERNLNVVLVFCTGFAEPAPRYFEVQPYRYIVKNMPVQQKDYYIREALVQMVANCERPKLLANANRTQYLIKLEHIIYIEKYKKNTRVHLAKIAYDYYGIELDDNGKLPVIRLAEKLEHVYERVRRYGFGCPHDSYIVNFSYVISCTAKELRLVEVNHLFQVTRSKTKNFQKAKDRFLRSKYVGDVYDD